jgi:hypothetical protein
VLLLPGLCPAVCSWLAADISLVVLLKAGASGSSPQITHNICIWTFSTYYC